jgi:hypothetical protein
MQHDLNKHHFPRITTPGPLLKRQVAIYGTISWHATVICGPVCGLRRGHGRGVFVLGVISAVVDFVVREDGERLGGCCGGCHDER